MLLKAVFARYRLAVPVEQTFVTLLMTKMQSDFKFDLMVLKIAALLLQVFECRSSLISFAIKTEHDSNLSCENDVSSSPGCTNGYGTEENSKSLEKWSQSKKE